MGGPCVGCGEWERVRQYDLRQCGRATPLYLCDSCVTWIKNRKEEYYAELARRIGKGGRG